MAGKGDRPRNCFSQAFRDNWDVAFGKKSNVPEAAKEATPHTFPKKRLDGQLRKVKIAL